MCSHLGGTDLGGEVSGVGAPGEVNFRTRHKQ